MLDLNEEDLEKLPSDRKVMKFMNEVKKVNEDPEFFSYMTKNAKKTHSNERHYRNYRINRKRN